MNLDLLLKSREFLQNPYPVYDQLRSASPVCWTELWGCWLLTRYEDVTSVLQDPQRFSSRGRVTNVLKRELKPPFLAEAQPLIDHYAKGLINVDPPDHTRLRRLAQKTFLPRTLERLRPRVEKIANDLVSEFEAGGKMDVVRDFAYPLPITVIAELLGVPAADRDNLKHWSGAILEFQAVPRTDGEIVLRSQKALLELREYFCGIFAERKRQPQEDLISELVAVEEQGDHLTEEELLSTCVSILIGGHETTTSLLSSAVWLFLNHPEQLAKLRHAPASMNGAVEEVLRFESPFQRLTRVVTEDLEICGHAIRKGQTVMCLLGAANRDPAQFPDPARFDVERSPNRHMAFAHGIHFCIGAGLARLEAPIALNVLFGRLPGLRLETSSVEWSMGVLRALRSLQIEF
ncbi:MAG TPA: cytochrome P450 [Verrucomicrobiae bacterium]|nr:cytochrome P450 [Verrucomicrobiae bacterium]